MTSQALQPRPNTIYDSEGPSVSRRACLACNRKKTKCDMNLPSCLLCVRTTTACVYPDSRKKRRITKDSSAAQSNSLTAIPCLPVVTDRFQDLGSVNDALFPLSDFHSSLGGTSLAGGVTDTTAFVPANTLPDILDSSQGIVSMDYPWVPYEVVEELVSLFFQKVHPFVPIIHKPRLLQKYAVARTANGVGAPFVDLKSSLLLNCILALAARFSKSSYFENTPVLDRGSQFGRRAADLYHDSLRTLVRKPSLEHLKGCILFAFYLYLSGPNTEGWLVIGTCTRLAYEMCLNRTDMDSLDTVQESAAQWSHKEELRRAWWSIWEIDTFSAAIACRPHALDRYSCKVKLPVSDEAWFADRKVESAIIDPAALHAWHALRGCENQDERAWYLVCNYLLLIAHDLGQQPSADATKIADIESALSCYSLLLPDRFHVTDSFQATGATIAQYNWILATNIMLQGAKVFVKFLGEGTSEPKLGTSSEELLAPLAAAALFKVRTTNYKCHTDQVIRILKAWPPEYLSSCIPFIACLFLGPAAIHARVLSQASREQESEDPRAGIKLEILRLALACMARYWGIGTLLSEKLELECGQTLVRD